MIPISLVFVDTSAFYAVLDADDEQHGAAVQAWDRLLSELAGGGVAAVTHSSILVETVALAQRRLGMAAVRAFLDDFVPLFEVVWVDADIHGQAATALLAADRRHVSLVDWTSFEMMRQRAIDLALAFDHDFWSRGFTSYG